MYARAHEANAPRKVHVSQLQPDTEAAPERRHSTGLHPAFYVTVCFWTEELSVGIRRDAQVSFRIFQVILPRV